MNLDRLRLVPRRDEVDRPVPIQVARHDELRSGGVFASRIDLNRREETLSPTGDEEIRFVQEQLGRIDTTRGNRDCCNDDSDHDGIAQQGSHR